MCTVLVPVVALVAQRLGGGRKLYHAITLVHLRVECHVCIPVAVYSTDLRNDTASQ